ncbi:competence/damage-inducible protein A [Paraferrimonas sedimenticola]|uniref:CinA-like protein n=1 Tax=Paraferrimonas sedimenticola TaxID=375674 RepID=A0AA37W069_9GAMM|nr:competence/damage-inducible protein A [Paraferrimonas sedimenticola]GLP95995.1 nicotinamide-nucleotide amidohydrolase PncC [Paraferrimonas sedimenticola]
MNIELICTGEEVLSGQITDTNATWLANQLQDVGLEFSRKTTVGDRMDDLVEVFNHRSQQADVILVNGGLGPTDDDLSAQAMAKAMGVELELNQEWYDKLSAWWAARGRPMTDNNRKQTMLPSGAVMIDNPVGTACGFRVKHNRAWLIFTPGVPHELKRMMLDHILPFITSINQRQSQVQVKKWMTFGVGESQLASLLESLKLAPGCTLGFRASAPQMEVKLIARDIADQALYQAQCDTIKSLIGDALVGEDYPTIAECLHHQLLDSELKIAAAESCTGGQLASQLVEFPGSSAYLQTSLVTYSNQAKQTLLGVPASTLEHHGAVSLQTAEAMAEGARAVLDCDFGVSVTGVAGPDGGSEDKPVGTVCFGLASREGVVSQRIQFGSRSRSWIRKMSCAVAYDMLRRAMLGQNPIADYPMLTRHS